MTKNIKVDDDLHRELGEIGKLSESYNDVIWRLVRHYEKTTMRGKVENG
jgi:predicted CopG family antitoxin